MASHVPYRVCRELRLMEPPLRGPDVKAIQHALRVRGLYQGPITGVYDRPTADAVARLKSITGAIPDGRVTREMYTALVVECTLDVEQVSPVDCREGASGPGRPSGAAADAAPCTNPDMGIHAGASADPGSPAGAGQLLPEVTYVQGPLTCRLGPLYLASGGETLFDIATRFWYLPRQVEAVNPHIPNPDRVPAGTVVALPFENHRWK